MRFRIFAGLAVLVILVGMIAIALAVLKLREDLYEMQAQADPQPAVAASMTPEVAQALDQVREEVSGSLTQTIDEVERWLRSAEADRKAMKQALARLLHQHGAETAELSVLLQGLTDEERRSIVAALEEDGSAGAHQSIRQYVEEMVQQVAPRQTESGDGGEEAVADGEGAAGGGEANGSSTKEGSTQGDEAAKKDGENEAEVKPPAEQVKPVYKTHTVQSGDGLLKIAEKYGVSVDAIAELNGIKDRNLLTVGQVLKIPGE